MLCCHKYPHKYCVFLDSCERAYFRWMIAEHKDVLLKDVFASHTFLGPTPFFFFLFFFSADVWDSILQLHWPDWSLCETTCFLIQHNNQASNCWKYSLDFFLTYLHRLMMWCLSIIHSFFFFFGPTFKKVSHAGSPGSHCSAAPAATRSSATCCKFHQGKLKRSPH